MSRTKSWWMQHATRRFVLLIESALMVGIIIVALIFRGG